MCFVNQTEVSLEPVEHFGVRPEQGFVAGQQCFERGLPPGQLELDLHLLFRHMPVRQVTQQRVQAEVGELGQHRGAFVQIDEHFALGRQARERVHELANGSCGKLAVGVCHSERHIEQCQVGGHGLIETSYLGNAGGHRRNCAGFRVALPERALLLNAHQRLVDIGNRDSGPHVLIGEFAQSAPVSTRHVVGPRRGGLNEFGNRPVKDCRLEPVQGVTDI